MASIEEDGSNSKLMKLFLTNMKDISPQDCTPEMEEREMHCCPLGMAVGGRGDMHVVLEANSRLIKVFTSEGNLVKVISNEGLLAPYDVTITNSGKMIVTDPVARDVKVFSRHGKLLLTSEFGQHLLKPYGIDYNRITGEIAICDQGANCVYLHDPKGLVKRILTLQRLHPEEESPHRSFLPFLPSHVKFHEQTEAIMVTDSVNQSICTFNPDGGCTAVCAMSNMRPSTLCISAEGSVYFTDEVSHCIYQMDCQGQLSGPVLGPEDSMGEALALAMDLNGRILVSENNTGLVKTFNLK